MLHRRGKSQSIQKRKRRRGKLLARRRGKAGKEGGENPVSLTYDQTLLVNFANYNNCLSVKCDKFLNKFVGYPKRHCSTPPSSLINPKKNIANLYEKKKGRKKKNKKSLTRCVPLFSQHPTGALNLPIAIIPRPNTFFIFAFPKCYI